MNVAITAISSNTVNPTLLDEENQVIAQAMEILDRRLFRNAEVFTNHSDVEHFLKLQFVEKQHEVFAVIFLNNRHQLISFEKMFNGSINSCTIHPREVVKRALSHNAAAAILCHNHPSGCTAPAMTI